MNGKNNKSAAFVYSIFLACGLCAFPAFAETITRGGQSYNVDKSILDRYPNVVEGIIGSDMPIEEKQSYLEVLPKMDDYTLGLLRKNFAPKGSSEAKGLPTGESCTTKKGRDRAILENQEGYFINNRCVAANRSSISIKNATEEKISVLSSFNGDDGEGLFGLSVSEANFSDFSILVDAVSENTLSSLRNLHVRHSNISNPEALHSFENLTGVYLDGSSILDLSSLLGWERSLMWLRLPDGSSWAKEESNESLDKFLKKFESCVFLPTPQHNLRNGCIDVDSSVLSFETRIIDFSFLDRFDRLEMLSLNEAEVDFSNFELIRPILDHTGIRFIESPVFNGMISIGEFRSIYY